VAYHCYALEISCFKYMRKFSSSAKAAPGSDSDGWHRFLLGSKESMQPGINRGPGGVKAGPGSPPTHRRERGQTTAEFVVVLPFLLLLFFLIIDFGWLLKNWIVVTNSAREAARCTVAVSCQLNGTDTTPSLLAQNRMQAGLTGNLININVPNPEYIDADGNSTPSAGDSIIICVDSENEWIGPIIGLLNWLTGSNSLPDPMPLRAREEMILERSPGYQMTQSIDNGACNF